MAVWGRVELSGISVCARSAHAEPGEPGLELGVGDGPAHPPWVTQPQVGAGHSKGHFIVCFQQATSRGFRWPTPGAECVVLVVGPFPPLLA